MIEVQRKFIIKIIIMTAEKFIQSFNSHAAGDKGYCRLATMSNQLIIQAMRFTNFQIIQIIRKSRTMTLFNKWLSGQDLSDGELYKDRQVDGTSDQLKSAFLANISHEIRTPLNDIHELVQMILKTEELAPYLRNDTQTIVERGNSLESIIDDFIYLSKIENNQLDIRKKPLELNDLMDQLYVLSQSNPHYLTKNGEQKNLKLMYDKLQGAVPIISDPDRLKHIMNHLIDNALKYTEQGFIRFGYTVSMNPISKNKYILFYVKDSGIGIPKDKKEKIFEKFVQMENTSSRKFGGLGLGLPIAKGLADKLYGKIWCESNIGKGTNFYFAIPYLPAAMPSNPDTYKDKVA